VTVLGIIEKVSRRQPIEQIIATVRTGLERSDLSCEVRIINGKIPEAIIQNAFPGRHLALFGPFGRPFLRRVLRGRSIRRIIAKIETPVLYVKAPRRQMKNILICMGGLGHASSAAGWGMNLAQRYAASVTALHVIEPISYDYPIAREIQEHWDHIQETDTPQGKNLRQALRLADDMEVPVLIKPARGMWCMKSWMKLTPSPTTWL
jgi:nucleotide-binding universal stress UspA family protein